MILARHTELNEQETKTICLNTLQKKDPWTYNERIKTNMSLLCDYFNNQTLNDTNYQAYIYENEDNVKKDPHTLMDYSIKIKKNSDDILDFNPKYVAILNFLVSMEEDWIQLLDTILLLALIKNLNTQLPQESLNEILETQTLDLKINQKHSYKQFLDFFEAQLGSDDKDPIVIKKLKENIHTFIVVLCKESKLSQSKEIKDLLTIELQKVLLPIINFLQ